MNESEAVVLVALVERFVDAIIEDRKGLHVEDAITNSECKEELCKFLQEIT